MRLANGCGLEFGNGILCCFPPQKLIMAHALQRVVFSTADTKKNLFALVARNPQTGPESVFCHIFHLPSREAVRVIKVI